VRIESRRARLCSGYLQNTPLTSGKIRSTVLSTYLPTSPPGTCSKDLARKQSPKLRPHVLLGRLQCANGTGWEERERSSEMRIGRLLCAGDARLDNAGVSQEKEDVSQGKVSQGKEDVSQGKVSQGKVSPGKEEGAAGGGQALGRTGDVPLQLLRQLAMAPLGSTGSTVCNGL
jgi:hypothetical protein